MDFVYECIKIYCNIKCFFQVIVETNGIIHTPFDIIFENSLTTNALSLDRNMAVNLSFQ